MATQTITFTDGGFPNNFSGNLEDFKNAIIDNLIGTIDSDNIIMGKIGGTAPTSNIGLWLDQQTVKVWSGSSYVPAKIVFGGSTNQVTFTTSGVTANRTITFPDKDGTVALTSDVYGGRATIILGAVTPQNIDWSLSNNFYKAPVANNVFNMINSLPGQKISFIINATGTITMTFNGVSFPTGLDIVQTASGVDLWEFKNIAGTIYGNHIKNFA